MLETFLSHLKGYTRGVLLCPLFSPDRTYCRKICPGFNVILQVPFFPWSVSGIYFLELAFTLIRNTTARLFHETGSGGIQNAVLLKAIERLKVS